MSMVVMGFPLEPIFCTAWWGNQCCSNLAPGSDPSASSCHDTLTMCC